ncbi:hypothetical protein HYW44_01340 [Candidatus Daviesbacteria bacterium]|nr:hypothetical protein [Candidatus Daviesbacteria bacterium]
MFKNVSGAISHLKEHQMYPATKDELVKECGNLSDFSDNDKKWFMDNLPEKTYKSAEEVMTALGWRKEDMGEGMQMGV